jgi:hypothetical protein
MEDEHFGLASATRDTPEFSRSHLSFEENRSSVPASRFNASHLGKNQLVIPDVVVIYGRRVA